MMLTMSRGLAAVLVAMVSVPAVAQPDPEGGLVFIGWSKKVHLATRSYTENFGIETSCAFDASIVDLITDNVVWQVHRDWREDNSGEPGSPSCPGAKAAWKAERAGVEAALKRFAITVAESREVKKFPFTAEGDSINVVVAPGPERWEVKAVSKTRGQKVITKGEVASWASTPEEGTPAISGWVAGPDPSRIAVVLQPPCFYQSPCPAPTVHGCHVRAGFTKK